MKKVRRPCKDPDASEEAGSNDPKRLSQRAAAAQIGRLFEDGVRGYDDRFPAGATAAEPTPHWRHRRAVPVALTRNGEASDGQDRLTYRRSPGTAVPLVSHLTRAARTCSSATSTSRRSLDIDHAVYLSNFEGINLGLDRDRKVDVYFHQPCGYPGRAERSLHGARHPDPAGGVRAVQRPLLRLSPSHDRRRRPGTPASGRPPDRAGSPNTRCSTTIGGWSPYPSGKRCWRLSAPCR